MLHRYRICFADASIPTHSPRAALIGVVDPWTPPPRRLPPRPHHFYGRISKVSRTLTGEYHIIQGAVESRMAALTTSLQCLTRLRFPTLALTQSSTCITS